MGLFDWLGKLAHEDGVHCSQLKIPAANILLPNYVSVTPQAEQHYVRIWLAEMFLRDGGKWFTKRYPLAYSLVSLAYSDQQGVDFANVSGKNRLEIKQTDLGRSVLYGYPLTPLLPFRGGTISLDCGLVSMATDNLVTSFASVVSEFAGKLGGAQVSVAADLAGSVASSVQALLGAGDAVSKLYYHNVFTATPGGTALNSGYLLLSDVPDGAIDPAQIWYTDAGLRQGVAKDALHALDRQDYLLFQIECVAERDDYQSFSYIAQPFNDALQARADGDDTKGNVLIAQAKRAVQASPDFTGADRKRVRLAIDKAYADDGWGAPGIVAESFAQAPKQEGPPPSLFKKAVMALTLAEAARMPDPEDM